MVKLENKVKIGKTKIGILGGSFDPAHKGHLAISNEALKRFNLKSVIWAITNQNPLKEKSVNDLKQRISFCKKIIGFNKLIKVKFFEDIVNSNKTADLINYLSKNNNLNEAAKNLYSFLRKIKNKGYKSISVEKIPNKGVGKVINDLLNRASKY